MERFRLFIILIFLQSVCFNSNGQNWTLSCSSGQTIATALIDSITYENVAGKYVQQIWHDSVVVSSLPIDYGMKLELQNIPLEYEYYTLEEDGMDAVLASDGSYALFYEPKENDNIIFVTGVVRRDTKEYIITDKDGYLKAMTIDGNGLVTFYYAPDQLWVLNEYGLVIAEIPYSYFEEDISTKAPLTSRSTSLINQALTLIKKIKDYLKKPIKPFCLNLLLYLSEEAAGNYGEALSDLIDAVLDTTDILNLQTVVDKLIQIQCFGNASILTLPAEVDFFDAKLSCEVNGLPTEGLIWYKLAKEKWAEQVDSKLELGMNLYDNVTLASFIEKKSTYIDSDCIESFDFTVDEPTHTYFYEPYLQLSVTTETDARAIYATIGEHPLYEIPEGKTVSTRSCTIFGERETFNTPGVSCSINEITNITDNTATITCCFSKLPDNADNYINVINKETGEVKKISATKTTEDQDVDISGLDPITEYEVYGVISINGQTYQSESKTFTTDTPDISGTWTCSETHYKYDNTPYSVTYSLTLNKDGSVKHSNYDNLPSGSWSFTASGKVNVSILTAATQTFDSGKDWTGTVDDIKNPTVITGSTSSWNVNQFGWHGGDAYPFVMTR